VDFEKSVKQQVTLLNEGKPLEAFDQFFDISGVMYANGEVFASSAEEGRKKQEPYIRAAVSIEGKITDVKMLPAKQICVFRNQSSFVTEDGNKHQIDGLCWQHWQGGKITEEQYFDGEQMKNHIKNGILSQPELLLGG
jgi:hypothetical protein